MALNFFSFLFLASAPLTLSLPVDHHDVKRGPLPSDWYHGDTHPVAKLFRRQNSTALPAVGSAAWTAQYPTDLPESTIPAEWMTALTKAVADGKIPNITIPTVPNGNDPDYGGDNNSPEICSSYYNCHAEGDIWDAPNGTLALSFDDGPVTLAAASPKLYDFMKTNSVKATHYMIGANILTAPNEFLVAFNDLQNHIAVHTWSHRHMSTLTNEQLIADIGWCMQIIHDSTGGRVPAFWRPPYGDADNRVRAIAKEIFGLTTVIWNYDSDDWNIGAQGITLDSVEAGLEKVLAGPKSPGLNILEHEISADDVTAFIYAYPLMKSNGWPIKSIPELTGANWYQNSKDNISPVTPMDHLAQYPSKSSITVATATSTTAAAGSSDTSTATSATAVQNPNSHVASSSSPTSSPRLWNTLTFLALTLGAYLL